MNAVIQRRPVMQYRDQEIRYDSDSEELEAEVERQQNDGKQYRTKRSAKPTRRRSAKSPQPGCGISARRNHRWTW
jgi:hypothetical protein